MRSDFDQLMAALAAGTSRLQGKDGQQIKLRIERIAAMLQQPDAPDLRDKAAAELDQLVRALATAGGGIGKAFRGVDAMALADGLRTFAQYLRAPSPQGEELVAELVQRLNGPVPLDELRVGGQVEALAIEAAHRRGLEGQAARSDVERMKREVSGLMLRLEGWARDEAARAKAAQNFEALVGRIVGMQTPLAIALDAARGPIVERFRRVDLAHMAEGLKELAEWLSTPADDPEAHVQAFADRMALILGEPTHGDPARPEDERRAAFEGAIQAQIQKIFDGAP